MPQQSYEYIDSNTGLINFCASLNQESYCAIDTEFIRERTYYPELALVQIASGNRLACIDPLAITEFTPLMELLVKQDLLKVFHSPSQDLEILYQKFAEVPSPVFDTQLAAAVLGYNHQVSYADLVRQITGIKLDKKHTRANWLRRPLTAEELDYAMDDVRYLVAVYENLKQKLESTRRSSWIEKDLQALSEAKNYQVDKAQLWKRLKGVSKLKGEKLQIASDLCQWREDLAQRKNKPRRWIAKDDALVEIARQKPEDVEALMRIPELSDKTAKRYGDELLAVIVRAAQVEPTQWPQHDKFKSMSKEQLALGDCLMALCRKIADQNQIALATLATRKDIDNLILNQKNSRLAQGWRFSMAGEQLLEFIHGQSAISVDNETLKLDPK